MRTWSYSSLDLYLACPLAYRFRYIDQIREEKVPAALPFGSALHAAHEKVYSDLRDKGAFDPEDAIAAFAMELELLLGNPLVEFKDGESLDTMLEKGVDMLRVFLGEVQPERVVDVDLEFDVPVNDGASRLRGYIDLVVEDDEGLNLVEFKSAGRRWPQADADSSLQATLYTLAAQQIFPGQNINVRFDVITKAKAPRFQSLGTCRGIWAVNRASNLIAAAEDAVDKGVFHPVQSFRCAGCAYRAQCKTWSYQPITAVCAAA